MTTEVRVKTIRKDGVDVRVLAKGGNAGLLVVDGEVNPHISFTWEEDHGKERLARGRRKENEEGRTSQTTRNTSKSAHSGVEIKKRSEEKWRTRPEGEVRRETA